MTLRRNIPTLPQPLLDYMGSEQWVYAMPTGHRIFLQPHLRRSPFIRFRDRESGRRNWREFERIEMLVAGLEPLDVPGLPEPLTAANVVQILRESWNPSQDIGLSSADWWAWFFHA